MTPMLKFSDVELYYDHVYALKGVSIELNQGETVALIGANGAGKSSILRAITGLRKIRKGQIEFEGQRINGLGPEAIVGMGIAMVPEGRRVFPFMSVRDNLLMGAFSRKDAAGVKSSLDMVLTRFPRLKERYSQAAGTMSGGEQQMLVIGRALMAKPKLLLLDEPSLGVAPKIVQDIARSIVSINRDEKVSVLLVEQNSRMALRQHQHLLADARGVPAVGELREPLEVGERQAERLADVADRAARAIRREARDERRVVVAVLLDDADDQLLADVAREVEVDVRHRCQLPVEEAAERKVVCDGIDM